VFDYEVRWGSSRIRGTSETWEEAVQRGAEHLLAARPHATLKITERIEDDDEG
jgi:hypothetical protein